MLAVFAWLPIWDCAPKEQTRHLVGRSEKGGRPPFNPVRDHRPFLANWQAIWNNNRPFRLLRRIDLLFCFRTVKPRRDDASGGVLRLWEVREYQFCLFAISIGIFLLLVTNGHIRVAGGSILGIWK